MTEIESLRQQLASKDAEIERLNAQINKLVEAMIVLENEK